MRKSILLASFLFATSAFSDYKKCESFYNDTCTPETCIDWLSSNWGQNCPAAGMTKFSGYTETSCYCDPNCDAPSVVDKFGNCTNPNDCLNGVLESDGSCNNNPPPADPMNAHNNDPAGCNAAGGYYFADGSCNGGAEAWKKIASDPFAVVGSLAVIGGVALSAGGVLALPFTGGMSYPAIGAGAWATGLGATMVGFSALQNYGSSTPPSMDTIQGDNRLKVSFKDPVDNKVKPVPAPTPTKTNPTPAPDSAGGAPVFTHATATEPAHDWEYFYGNSPAIVSKTDTTTGKVDEVSTIPPAVMTQLNSSTSVNTADGSLTAPINLDGTQTTKYDYNTGTATTTTHSTGSTSSNPITTTKTTPITVTQNPDGTVTTTPNDPTVAPTVSGANGGTVVSSPTTSGTGGTGAGTGGSTGNGPDYTGVLNDIKKNTGDSSSFLDKILGMFKNTDSVDTSKASGSNADGHDGFDGLKGDLQGSFDGFVFTDPLGLNGMGGAGIASYGFTMLGHHYVILDQAMIDLLPLSLLRGLFLFLAALAGLITVVSGV